MVQYQETTTQTVDLTPKAPRTPANTHSKVTEDYGDRLSVKLDAVAAGAFGAETSIPEGTLLSDTGAGGYVVHDGANTPSAVLDQPVNVARLEQGDAITTAFANGTFNKAGLFEFDGTNFVTYTEAVAVAGAVDHGATLLLN